MIDLIKMSITDFKGKSLIGEKYGKLLVINLVGYKKPKLKKYYYWNCLCSCGNIIKVCTNNLKTNNTKSCGCLYKEPKTHGMSLSPEYKAWRAMKYRCLNKNDKGYKNYGGRDINVCDEWKNNFEKFYEDMGKRPNEKYSIDRINNNDNYYKENCRWSTNKVQANNRRTNHLIEFEGKIQNISQWAEHFDMSPCLIRQRLKKNWDISKIFIKFEKKKKLN